MQRILFDNSKVLIRIIINAVLAFSLVLGTISLRYPNAPKNIAYKVLRDYVRVSMNWKTRNWSEMQGKYVLVKYRPEDAEVAKLVLETAEEAYAPVNAALEHEPPGIIPIILYPDASSLNKSFGWAADESAMGVYWAGVIRVLSPTSWIESPDIEERFKSDGPMAHEYAHLVVDYVAHGNYPRWLTEGIAQRVERELTGFEMALTGPMEIYPISDMDAKFDLLPNQSAAYRQSLAMVDYLVNQYGEDALKEILTQLGKGRTLNGAFKEIIGINVNQFVENFTASMKVQGI